jgi:predicted ATP-grasp superfamily ATP-dependent carboligase
MTELGGTHVLIVGVTTRAMAISAARAGYRVTAVDAFGDVDLRSVAEVIVPAVGDSRFDPMTAVLAGASVPAELVAYTSNLENYPRAVERLRRGRSLLGNSPAVLSRVRDPETLCAVLHKQGFAVPRIRSRAPRDHKRTWIFKPRRSGGGHGVVVWQRGHHVTRDSYLQERIPGVPGSVVFAANGADATVLGLSRQIVGDSRFGAQGFRYCGSLLGSNRAPVFTRQDSLLATATRMARVVTNEFGLVGLNGIDFIARSGVPYPLEVNPRYSASMELLERASGISMFEIHARACQGELPVERFPVSRVEGKAIVFAKRGFVVRDAQSWFHPGAFADIPRAGTTFHQGNPVCTVFAQAADPAACVTRLVRQAGAVYRRSRVRAGRAA